MDSDSTLHQCSTILYRAAALITTFLNVNSANAILYLLMWKLLFPPGSGRSSQSKKKGKWFMLITIY